MDIVSIYIIPIGATLGAVSWFWVMRREDLLEEQGGPGPDVQPVGKAGGNHHQGGHQGGPGGALHEGGVLTVPLKTKRRQAKAGAHGLFCPDI